MNCQAFSQKQKNELPHGEQNKPVSWQNKQVVNIKSNVLRSI